MNIFHNKKIISVFILCTVISFLIGFSLTTYLNKPQPISTEKNKEIVNRLVEEVWTKGNLEVVDQLVAPQYTIKHDPGDEWEGKTLDLATFKERVKLSHQVFPDQKFYIEDVVAEGDKVAISWNFTATHKGDIPGLPATNKPVKVSGLTIYYLSNGKVTGHWQVVDRLGFLGQLKMQIEQHKN